MSSDNSTQFQFRLGGIELEISGSQAFVEKMYARVMRDIESSVAAIEEQHDVSPTKSARGADLIDGKLVWVHRCSPMMHKIYMSSPAELTRSPLMRAFNAGAVKILFADKSVFDRVLPAIEKGATLWAELTETGRRRIAGTAKEK